MQQQNEREPGQSGHPAAEGDAERFAGSDPRSRDLIAEELARSVPAETAPLVDALRTRWGDALVGILFYGSILRGAPVEGGLIDLVAVIVDYRSAYRGRRFQGFLNRVLPPNVFYLAAGPTGCSARSKYTVISVADLRRYVSSDCFQVYYWGRLAQPCALAWVRDEEGRQALGELVSRAVATFLAKVGPLVASPFDAETLWTVGLGASYGAELRPERVGVGERLVAADPQRYARLASAIAPTLGWRVLPAVANGEAERYDHGDPPGGRRRWRFRRWHGKALNALRLLKATATFEGGIDYVIWKVERHSQVKIKRPSPGLRRIPPIAGLVVLWRILRARAVR